MTSQVSRLTRLPDGNRSVAKQVATVLRDRILEGELASGERIGQDWVCDQLGVSPAPVREALRQLEAEGLVEHRPNRGVFVLALSEEELREVVAPIRLLLEQYAIGRALTTHAEQLVEGLGHIVVEMTGAVAMGDLEAVNDADVRFHQLAVSLCEQPHTEQLWRSITPRLRAQFARLAPRVESPKTILAQHRDLLDAIRSGDGTLIQTALYEHLIVDLERLLEKRSP